MGSSQWTSKLKWPSRPTFQTWRRSNAFNRILYFCICLIISLDQSRHLFCVSFCLQIVDFYVYRYNKYFGKMWKQRKDVTMVSGDNGENSIYSSLYSFIVQLFIHYFCVFLPCTEIKALFNIHILSHQYDHSHYIINIRLSRDRLIFMIEIIISGYTGGNRTMVAAATIVIMAAAKKMQQNVFALYHSYNHTILLGFIWILDFHFKIVLVRRRRYLIPIRCNNGKRKICPWRWLHHFDF